MIAKIAIGKPVHQAVCQRIQFVCGARLRYAGATAAKRTERRDGNRCWSCICGGRWRSEIHMELEKVEVVGAKKHLEVGRARWRRGAAIEIGRQQTADRRTLLEADLRCGLAGQHRC